MSLQIDRLLTRLALTGRSQREVMEPILERQTRLLISSSGKIKGLTQATPPFRLDVASDSPSQAHKRGQAAVAAGIRRTYGTPGDLYVLIRRTAGKAIADNYWAYYKTGRQQDASRVAQQTTGFKLAPFDSGRAHKDRRDNRGRVNGRRKSLFVADQHRVEQYIKTTQKSVGYLDSALVSKGRSTLGSLSAVPSFVSRHSAPFGSVLKIADPKGERYRVAIRSHYGGIDLQDIFDTVLDYRRRAFARELPYALAAILRKSARR